uniref:Putative ovule protein n=1 Tax=Solanum chacoense TaxID=4108 RepID=A0A0V0GLH6_SOLCH
MYCFFFSPCKLMFGNMERAFALPHTASYDLRRNVNVNVNVNVRWKLQGNFPDECSVARLLPLLALHKIHYTDPSLTQRLFKSYRI